jgi:hypothetical protein
MGRGPVKWEEEKRVYVTREKSIDLVTVWQYFEQVVSVYFVDVVSKSAIVLAWVGITISGARFSLSSSSSRAFYHLFNYAFPGFPPCLSIAAVHLHILLLPGCYRRKGD